MGHWRDSVHRDGNVMNRSSMVHNSVGIDRMVVMVCSVVLCCWVSNVGRFGLVSDGSFHFSVVRISDDSLGRMGRSSVMHFMVKSMRVNHYRMRCRDVRVGCCNMRFLLIFLWSSNSR